MKTLTKDQLNIDKIKNLMWEQTASHPLGMPQYYGVLYYRNAFDPLTFLSDDEMRKRWDITEVKKTHKFITNLIRKAFGNDVPVWWTIERHRNYTDDCGNTKQGMFHSNLYVGSIDDDVLDNPSPYLTGLFGKEDDMGIPIGMRNVDTDTMKLLLLGACIRQAKWVGNNRESLSLNDVPCDEMEQTFYYGLKDFNSNMNSITTVIDWENSSFYTPSI